MRHLLIKVTAVAVLGLGGCTVVDGILKLPDLAIRAIPNLMGRPALRDPVEVQARVIRFADHYLESVSRNMRLLQRDGKPISRREVTRRRIRYTNEVLAIATGSNAFANLLDMVVLVTLTRMRVEHYWKSEARNLDVEPVLAVFRSFETEIWRISGAMLSADQQSELRQALGEWLQKNPKLRFAIDVVDSDFVSEIRDFSGSRSNSAPASVFSLLRIDPLSGLDPAARELAETRLMAERALFLSRHLPELIRWETEYFTMNTLEIPEISKLLTQADRLSTSAERVSQLSDKLPEVIGHEREQLIAAMKSERQGLTALAAESRMALNAGKQMADSANATLKSFQAIVAHFDAKPADPDAPPFRIAEYTEAATQIARTSDRLSDLLSLFNGTLGGENLQVLTDRIDLATQKAETRGRVLVDYAYRKVLQASAMIGAMALGFWLAGRLIGIVLRRRFG